MNGTECGSILNAPVRARLVGLRCDSLGRLLALNAETTRAYVGPGRWLIVWSGLQSLVDVQAATSPLVAVSTAVPSSCRAASERPRAAMNTR